MQSRNTVSLVIPNSAGFLPCQSLALYKTLFPYCTVCTRELQVLLDATSSLHTKHSYTGGLQILPTSSITISLGGSIYKPPCNSADISSESSGRTKYLCLCILMLNVNARTNTGEVGVDHMNTKLKVTNRLLTNNCRDFPTRSDQYNGFIIYEQIHLYFSYLYLLLEALTLSSTELNVIQES